MRQLDWVAATWPRTILAGILFVAAVSWSWCLIGMCDGTPCDGYCLRL